MSSRIGTQVARSLAVAVALEVLLAGPLALAESEVRDAVPQRFQSRSFVLYTDLTPDESQKLLERLETLLQHVSRYWGRPHRGIITMYVFRDLEAWPVAALNRLDPAGIAAVRSGGGLTLGTVWVRGNEFRSKAVIYAVADHGTPQHEAVHAYCNHAFGGTGPVWYSEGMAEVGNYWIEGDTGVSAPARVIRYLQASPTKPLDEIVNNPLEQTGDSWQNYAWRWALCHLLGHNENYARRFKPLGLQLLSRKDVSFWQVYGSQAQEIEFEYRQFLNALTPGYRNDLCSWDWKTRFTSPKIGHRIRSQVEAARGWQASRLLVSEGQSYRYSADGRWKLDPDQTETGADGLSSGRGRLVGVIEKDYQLSEPFDLGGAGIMKAPCSGKLFLRCREEWGSLADNSGKISVHFEALRGEEMLTGNETSAD